MPPALLRLRLLGACDDPKVPKTIDLDPAQEQYTVGRQDTNRMCVAARAGADRALIARSRAARATAALTARGGPPWSRASTR
jgi:hypothetical protein